MASVTLEIVSWLSSVPSVAARWCWMSRIVIPPAYKEMIISSSPPRRRAPFGTTFEANVLARSLGVSRRRSPISVATVFGVLPLRELPDPCPARSPRS